MKPFAGILGVLALVASPASGEEKIDFATQIYPMIKGSCTQCHRPPYEDERGRTRRPKAGLLLTTKADILKGGDTQQAGEEGVSGATGVIVPGDPDKSEFVIRIELPLESDDHQPPEGKAPQPTKAEVALLRAWIKQGADFGDWTEDPKPNEVPEWDGKEFADDHVRTAK